MIGSMSVSIRAWSEAKYKIIFYCTPNGRVNVIKNHLEV